MASAHSSILGRRQPRYILGHDRDELDRLIDQARFFGDLTEEVLRRAGVEPGMRVLDVGCGNVSFVVQELSEVTVTAPVDALVGRLVLMYLDDPAAALGRLLEAVRPGGVVAFQEMDMGAVVCEPDCALFTTSGDRIVQTFARAPGWRAAPTRPSTPTWPRPPAPCSRSWSVPGWPPPPRSGSTPWPPAA